jgi:hypothetical protein
VRAKQIFSRPAQRFRPDLNGSGLPEKVLFAFEPTSFFGVYRMEEFFFSS